MKKHQKILVGLIFVALVGSVLPSFLLSDLTEVDPNLSNLNQNPLSADSFINSTHVTVDQPFIYRVINSVNITFDNSEIELGEVTETFSANLSFSDNSSMLLPLFNSSLFPDVWSALFTPSVTNITGDVEVFIIPSDLVITNNIYDATFEIRNNLPSFSVQLDKSDYLRGDTIHMDFYPSDVEQSVADLKWIISLYRSGSDIPVEIFVTNESIFEYDYAISNDTETGTYYINATCWDFDHYSEVIYYFEILNNEPAFTTVQFEFEDGIVGGLTTDINDWYEIYRGNNFTLRVNATDFDTDLSDLRLTVESRDPLTGLAIFFNEFALLEPSTDENTWLFEVDLIFPLSMNLGLVEMVIIITEIDPEIDPETNPTDYVLNTINETQGILIMNNLPTFSNFFINGESGAQISVTTADILNITFVIEDEEDQYLWGEANDDGEKPIGYLTLTFEKLGEILEYTIPYNYDSDIVFSLKTSALGAGDWSVSFSFQDKDGGLIIYSDAPALFTVTDPANISPMNWLMLGVGIMLGGVVVFGSTYSMIKSRSTSKVRSSLPEKSVDSKSTPSDVSEEVEEKKESKKGKKPGRKL
ncbi:MAG: hypothetical protein ACTSRK_06105 [Promethearchaeota archaeon]